MRPEIVVLGGGIAGTLTANRLAARLGTSARIRLVDSSGLHVYPPGFIYLALGRTSSQRLVRDLRGLLHDDIELVIDDAELLDPVAGALHLQREGPIGYDYLVLATGARLDGASVPGLNEAAHDFYSMTGAERVREALHRFEGGDLVIGVAGMPYRCPPAPMSFTLMVDDLLRKRGVRDRTRIRFLSPLNQPFPIQSASELVNPILEQREIELHTFVNVERVDPDKRLIHSLEGESFEFDLAVLVPPHSGAALVADSGLGDSGGWVPTDPATLRVKGYEQLFAIGDATDLPISKSGSTAHFEAPVVVEQIAAAIEKRDPDPVKARYSGKVICFLEVGGGKATVVALDYEKPPRLPRPSRLWHAAKWMLDRVYWYTVPKGRF